MRKQKLWVCKRPYVTVHREQSTVFESRLVRKVQQGGLEDLRVGWARPGCIAYPQIGF